MILTDDRASSGSRRSQSHTQRHTPIPCRRPRIEIVAHPSIPDLQQAQCQVPTCDWTFDSVKTACEEAAVGHRRWHRDAVPVTRVVRDVEWDVHCEPCGGHRRTFGTKAEAETWREDHLVTEHGLVVCR